MDLPTTRAIELAIEAHQRLVDRTAGLTDEQARRPSLLPDWTVGHVLTHIARNADGQSGRLAGALRGEEVQRYPGGSGQRDGDIEAGAGRTATELIEDIAASNARLESVWRDCEAAGWPYEHLMAGDSWAITDGPIRRLREVEIHHYDLGLGYAASAWSDDYAGWELDTMLSNLPGRLDPGQTRALVLWLTGRTREPQIQLGDW